VIAAINLYPDFDEPHAWSVELSDDHGEVA